MDCSTPGLPVHHQLPEFTQTHIASDGQSTGVSASASVLPMNTLDQSPLGWTGWISLLSKGLSRVFSKTTVQKFQLIRFSLVIYFIHSSVYISTLSPIHPTSSFPLWYTQVCSLHLYLYFCFADKFICTIFLDFTYKQYYAVFVCLFLTYFTLHDSLWVCPHLCK